MATPEGVTAAMKLLQGAIPGARVNSNTAESWLTLFSGISDEQLMQASKDVAVRSTYFPVPREIMAAVQDHKSDPFPGGLRGMAQRLEDAAYAGEYDPAEWERLAQVFDKAGRQYGAVRIRERSTVMASLVAADFDCSNPAPGEEGDR